MGLFGKILEKLGITHEHTTQPSAAPPAPAPMPAQVGGGPSIAPAPAPAAAAPAVVAIPVVDVVAQLEKRAAENPQKLNWKTSIVDLLKLLNLDSSLGARKGHGTELGCPAELMNDSAQMNMWLHKTVLAKIAENGGNVPKELLG